MVRYFKLPISLIPLSGDLCLRLTVLFCDVHAGSDSDLAFRNRIFLIEFDANVDRPSPGIPIITYAMGIATGTSGMGLLRVKS